MKKNTLMVVSNRGGWNPSLSGGLAVVWVVGLTATLLACDSKQTGSSTSMAQAKPPQQVSSTVATQALPPGHPPIGGESQSMPPASMPVQPPSAAGTFTGPILETMNAAGYTYMRLGTPQGDVWTAVQATNVKKGQTVTVQAQMVAEKFQSSALHRTFDKLVMGSIVTGEAKAAAAALPPGSAAEHMRAAADLGDVAVPKAEGGKTIAETWAAKGELKDKPIVIRGKVVKFLSGIMSKNWIHLRDGSGKRADGTDDMTVTTQETAKVGDVITVRGTVRVDRDFGAGYLYPVLVEDAKLQK
ncbi:MAG: nucleotide-binding protein [Acidobacteriota bacterium]